MSRLCAIPFTTDVPGRSGGGTLTAGPGELTVTGASGSWSVDLAPERRPDRPDHARWLRRGLAGTLIGLGAGVTALALNLPADDVPGVARQPGGPVAGSVAPSSTPRSCRPSSAPSPSGRRPLAGPGGTP